MKSPALYVVLNEALAPGPRVVQACHAVHHHLELHPEDMPIRTLVALTAPDLEVVEARLRNRGIPVTRYADPDLGGVPTALCAGPNAGRWLSSLPLAR